MFPQRMGSWHEKWHFYTCHVGVSVGVMMGFEIRSTGYLSHIISCPGWGEAGTFDLDRLRGSSSVPFSIVYSF